MPKNVGKVIALFISNTSTKSRENKSMISFDTDGIHEDKYYGKETQRSVLITSLDSYDYIKTYNIEIEYGALGENLLIDYNPYHLKPGQRLRVGSIILEITQYCTICNHLSHIDIRLPELLKNDRGIFAKVVQEGTVEIDDDIFLC